MLHLTEETTVKEILDACAMSIKELADFCNKKGEIINTEGDILSDDETLSEDEPLSFEDKDAIDTTGFGIIDGGKKAGVDSKINKVANLFARKLRNI